MLRLVFALVFTIALGHAAESQKFGYANTQEIISKMPELQEANSQIEVLKNMFSKKGQEMVQSLRTKYQDLQKKQASGEIAPATLEREGAALKAEEEKIVEFEQTSQQKIYEKSEELMNPIQEKVNKAIKDVAAEHGYLYIFDTATGIVIYADPAADVSHLIKGKLGLKI
jgi:outer membrane protein